MARCPGRGAGGPGGRDSSRPRRDPPGTGWSSAPVLSSGFKKEGRSGTQAFPSTQDRGFWRWTLGQGSEGTGAEGRVAGQPRWPHEAGSCPPPVVVTVEAASPAPQLCPSPWLCPSLVRHWWVGRIIGTSLPQASQNQMAESGGSLRAPLPRLPLQVNSKHALPAPPPQKKNWGERSSSLRQSWTAGCSLSAGGSYGGVRGGGARPPASRPPTWLCPSPSPEALTADPTGDFPASPMQQRSQDPLVPPLVDKLFSRRVESATSPSTLGFPFKVLLQKGERRVRVRSGV